MTTITHCTCTFRPLALLRTVANKIEAEDGLAEEAKLIRSCVEGLTMDSDDRELLEWAASVSEQRAKHLWANRKAPSDLAEMYERQAKRLRELVRT